MGCGGSADKGAAARSTEKERRRLSVGHVDGKVEEGTGGASEADRGLVTQLNEHKLIELMSEFGGRRFSIGSDLDDNRKQSFANKLIQKEGDEVDLTKLGIGYTCRKGLKPESPNQDSWFVLRMEEQSMYCVLDGHGKAGHDCSQFVKDTMPKLMIKDKRFKSGDVAPMMTDVFKQLQTLIVAADNMKKVSAQLSGTTATILVHEHKTGKVTVAHVADSSAVMGSWTDASKRAMKAVPLTRDHKPDLPDEKARIESKGGRVIFDGYANHRVYAARGTYPGLNMSRCLGDIVGHDTAGITCEPEIKEFTLKATDELLLVCSDGVWEFITPQEACDIVSQYPPSEASKAADTLAKEAWDRWIKEEEGSVVDDITVILVYPHLSVQPH
mmetsp:Transcript_33213/g.77665  ORF Transcript_33213/g.77665 Transcript_33213/m.77665 type:complete len:385 (-) Transcript_33213:237-1391(-)